VTGQCRIDVLVHFSWKIYVRPILHQLGYHERAAKMVAENSVKLFRFELTAETGQW